MVHRGAVAVRLAIVDRALLNLIVQLGENRLQEAVKLIWTADEPEWRVFQRSRQCEVPSTKL